MGRRAAGFLFLLLCTHEVAGATGADSSVRVMLESVWSWAFPGPPRHAQSPVDSPSAGPRGLLSRSPAQPALAEDPMPGVHMVYMYANGSDPGIAEPRKAAGGGSTAGSRDRDNGELRFSLRSLDKFAPWFRGKVIILQGDDKPPYWLNTSHPRVMVVNHHTYFANLSVLPTFNSDAIHANIHLVPPIVDADIFINWCDDFFLGRPVLPSDWVRDGKPVVYHERSVIDKGWDGYVDVKAQRKNKWLGKVYRTRGVVDREFPRAAPGIRRNFVKHAPFPFSVRVLREMADVYKAEYELTQTFKFRTYDTLDVPTLHNMYCQVKDACVLDPLAVVDEAAHLSILVEDERNYEELMRVFAFQPPKFFTFNDGFSSTPPGSVEFAFGEFLPSMFPTPSQYELQGVP